MARLVIVLFAIAFLSQSDVLIRQTLGCTSSGDCKPCLRPGSEPGKEIYNKSPDVTELALEKTEVHIPPKANDPKSGDYQLVTVGVTTIAEDPEGDVLTYNYMISGGRIVGTGAKVFWNLNGLLPGTYTITAGVDDGCGVCGKTVTQALIVVQD